MFTSDKWLLVRTLISAQIMSPSRVETNIVIKFCALADPGGGHPARAPTNGRGPMILYATNCFSIYFRLLRLQFILNIIFIEICPKHSKDDFKNPP